MNKKQKTILKRIIITIVLLILYYLLLEENNFFNIFFYLVPYFIIGHDILKKALKGILKRQVFDENFLMAIATIGSFGLKDYQESVMVMLFYQIGELFQSIAVGKSRKNIASLIDLCPDYAYLKQDNDFIKVSPAEIKINSLILVKVGDRVPIDGVVIDGESTLNMAALTGESKPVEMKIGDEILSGSINMSGPLIIKTLKEFNDSTANKIMELIENATNNKAKSEDFIAKFAHYYTPIVCYLALALALVPPIFILIVYKNIEFSKWLYRSLTFLVISCPCALVISIPLSFFGGIGACGKRGILIKGSNYLERLAKSRCIAFDKTGTMTKGVFEVSAYHDCKISKEELLEYAAYCETFSNHPIGKSIVKEYGKEIDNSQIGSIKEISGKGIVATIFGKNVLAGNNKLMMENGIQYEECREKTSIVYLAIDGRYVGHIHVADKLKDNSIKCIEELKKLNVEQLVLLTGDKKAIGEEVGKMLGMSTIKSELLPQDKLTELEKLLNNNQNVIFIGDGINDAPVIARADVGVAMGTLGSDGAIEAADVVLMDDDPYKIVLAKKIAKKCMAIVYENIYFAIGVKVVCLLLSALGYTNMGLAIFADVGVMVIAVINALRVLNTRSL